MTQRHIIINELTELQSILANAGSHNVYQVPIEYFDNLADEVLKRVKAMDANTATEELENLSPLLSGLSKKMPHSVPAGYFDTLGKKIEQTLSTSNKPSAREELEILSPLLTALKNKPTYTTPAGYFENLLPVVDTETKNPGAKVISMTSRKWLRYASAAVITGLVASIGFFTFNKNGNINPQEKSYAWVEKNLKKVSTDEINEFVELANAETPELAKLDTKQELSNLLKDVSDKEIQEFLNDTQLAETGADDDIILN